MPQEQRLRRSTIVVALLLFVSAAGHAQKRARLAIDERNVRAEMNFLAGDALQGRGSGTLFERIAAEYVGSQFMQFGLEPAGDVSTDGKPGFVQTVEVPGREALSGLTIGGPADEQIVFGRDMVALAIASREISGPLRRLGPGEAAARDSIVLLEVDKNAKFADLQSTMAKLRQDGAAAIIVRATDEFSSRWTELAAQRTTLSRRLGNLFVVSESGFESLSKRADGTRLTITAQFTPGPGTYTWNAIGKLTGSDAKLAAQVILISSHLDHLGLRPNAPGEDKIFNGADDDASGTVAVMELARVLASGQRPRRTVYFVCFGSEEAGGFGANYFVNNLPFQKKDLVANLEFEMIGRPDEAVRPDELWLTGFERSNLGPELARRGAKLVRDPHPEQNFFQRSDNFTLARQGIIAHTVSSFGLHKDYHQATDEIRTIDFAHMTRSINSMVQPIRWLVNSRFVPTWLPGKDPSSPPVSR